MKLEKEGLERRDAWLKGRKNRCAFAYAVKNLYQEADALIDGMDRLWLQMDMKPDKQVINSHSINHFKISSHVKWQIEAVHARNEILNTLSARHALLCNEDSSSDATFIET